MALASSQQEMKLKREVPNSVYFHDGGTSVIEAQVSALIHSCVGPSNMQRVVALLLTLRSCSPWIPMSILEVEACVGPTWRFGTSPLPTDARNHGDNRLGLRHHLTFRCYDVTVYFASRLPLHRGT